MKKQFLEGGKICTAHGVNGLVKTEHFCDSPKVLAGVKRIFFADSTGYYSERKVLSSSVAGNFVLLGIEGICNREEAIAYRGRTLYLHRDDIPRKNGNMLLADMLGLPVYHAESGEPLGEISDISDVAGRRIYSVKYHGKDVLIPDVPQFIKEIDENTGMKVLPIPGFFDEADEV